MNKGLSIKNNIKLTSSVRVLAIFFVPFLMLLWQKGAADDIRIINDQIITMDESNPTASSLLISGNRIIDIAINELATDSYTQVDVEVSWIPTQLEGFTFSLIARNIGDEEIRNHTSYLKDRLSEPGRNINLTVQYGF